MSEAFERAVKHALKTDWSSLGVEEDKEGALLFPDQIERRGKDGKTTVVQEVRLRLPTNPQRVRARVRAREWLGELKLDEDRDADFFSELESYELLAFCIREPKPPHDQHVIDGKALFKMYLPTSIKKLEARLSLLIDACDPRYGELTADECWKVALRIAAHGEPSPLADIAGFDQRACITFLAKEALKSPTAPPWARSPSTSKPADQKTGTTSSSSSA